MRITCLSKDLICSCRIFGSLFWNNKVIMGNSFHMKKADRDGFVIQFLLSIALRCSHWNIMHFISVSY
jgi:hypothetical protein